MKKSTDLCQIFKRILPLVLSIVAIAFLFGTMLTYKIKYVNEGTSEAIKEEFNFNLVSAFDSSLAPSWTIIATLIFLILGGVLPFFTFFKDSRVKECFAISSTFSYLFAICFLISYKEIFSYFAADLIDNFYSADLSYAIPVSISLTSFGAMFSLSSSDKQYGDNVRSIVEDGLLVALAFVLNFIKLPITTGAGSINFQMLPLFLIALRRGPLHGFVAGGIIYGLLTCVTDGYGIQTYPFDYLIGFGSVAVLGFFQKIIMNKDKNFFAREGFLLLGCFIATFIRYIGSSVSSMVFYGLTFGDALLYNIIYIPVSGLIATLVIMVALYPLTIINERFPVKQ